MFLGGCPCCGGKSKAEECCFCSNQILQYDLWEKVTGDYGEDGSGFDSSDFFEAAVVVGWGDTVVWSGVLPSDLIKDNSIQSSSDDYFTTQPTSAFYNYTSGSSQVQKLYEYPVSLGFNIASRSLVVRWGTMISVVQFLCDAITKERIITVRQPIVTDDTEGECPIGVRSSYSNISGLDVDGNSLVNDDCGSTDSTDTDTYNNENCNLGVVSQVFAGYEYHGSNGDRPCVNPGTGKDQIPQQYIQVTLSVKDKRLQTVSPCYVFDPDIPGSPEDGSETGLCNGRKTSQSLVDNYCSVRRKCDCQQARPHSNNIYGNSGIFLPGETTACKCCCFLPNTNTSTLDGAFLINESNATFKDKSPYNGLKSLVFVTDGTDPNFGDEVRVVAMLAERNMGFTITDFFEDNTGYSTLLGRYTPTNCQEIYEEAFYNVVSCQKQNYLQHTKYYEYYPPVYRSPPFDPTGPKDFDEWKEEQTELALNAACGSSGWDWNFYVYGRAHIDEYRNDMPFNLTWFAGFSNGEGKAFSDTLQTTDGPLIITGNLEVTQTFDDECGYAGDCEFPTQTADTITFPVTDEECCTRGSGTFTPTTGGRTMPTTTTGPGTHLKNMLKWFNIHAKEKGCKCAHWEKKMNQGPQWCRDHMQEILDHLAKEAKKRRLPFVRLAAEKMVGLAIRKAEKDSA